MIGGNGNVIGGGTLGRAVLGGALGRPVVGGALGWGAVVRGADPRCASATVGNKTSATTLDAHFIRDRLGFTLMPHARVQQLAKRLAAEGSGSRRRRGL
jgi:hypothetical protein